MSQRTDLCVVNCSGYDVTVTVTNVSGFENPNVDPTHFLTNNLKILNNTSACDFVEMNNSGPSMFTLTFHFPGGKTLSVTCDQQQAKTKHIGKLTTTGDMSGMIVWQSTGGNVNGSSHGTNGLWLRPEAEPDHSSWMRDVVKRRPDVTLSTLMIPGSHDAGIYTITNAFDTATKNDPAVAIAQGRRVSGQLAAGSRYFDVRVYNYYGTLYTGHWTAIPVLGDYGGTGALLNDVLNDVKAFLQSPAGSDEVVILKFSHTHDADSTPIIVKRVQDILGGLLYHYELGTAVNLAKVPLTDLKGRVLAVFDTEFKDEIATNKGILPYHDVPIEPTPAERQHTSALWVYDHWANDVALRDMYKDQLEKVFKYSAWNQDYLFLLSWTCSGKPGVVLDVEVLAGMANPWLPRALMAIPVSNTPNVVLLDFVDPFVCGLILAWA